MFRQTRIKICGLKTVEDARVAVDCGAHAIGLVFAENSPRYVTEAQAAAIISAMPAFVDIVGLFVNQSAEQICKLAGRIGLKSIQLHGDEPVTLINELKPYSVIRAVPCKGSEAELKSRVDSIPVSANALLFDAPPKQTDAGLQMGGTGEKVDWQQLASMKSKGWTCQTDILAGGLTAENVAEAIRIVKPFAVDVSSGVERERGVKDPKRIEAFCQAVISAQP